MAVTRRPQSVAAVSICGALPKAFDLSPGSGEGPFSFRVHSSWFIYCICFHQGLEVRTQFALGLALFGGSTGNSSQPRTAGGKGRGSVLGWGAKCWSPPCSYSAIPAWPANVPVRNGLEVSRITWEFDLLL